MIGRRDFMKAMAAGTLGGWLLRPAKARQHDKRPNILLILTDQQTATAMSCSGNRNLRTPAMDSLAAMGTRFNKAYVTQPLCLPCRSSLQTGRYPHEIGTINNGTKMRGEFPMLGNLVAKAGYKCHYIGKWHVGTSLEAAGYPSGSNVGLDDKKAAAACEFLKQPHTQPFFLTVSLMNPHNVCQLARGQKLPDGPIGEPPTEPSRLPPLPPNFAVPAHEPSAIRKVQKSSTVHYPTADWDELKWRQYLWGYYRLVEKVDAEIARVLAALKTGGHANRTVIVFVSDHGEGVAMHHWNQKQILYDQATRVPLIVAWPGVTRVQVCEELVSTALDIPVTILDLVGSAKPASMRGLSLRPIATGKQTTLNRQHVIAETMFARGGKSLGLIGRMVRTAQYKYCIYDNGENREQLFDMHADPGEMTNLAVMDAYQDQLNHHRRLLTTWARETNDSAFPYIAPTARTGPPK